MLILLSFHKAVMAFRKATTACMLTGWPLTTCRQSRVCASPPCKLKHVILWRKGSKFRVSLRCSGKRIADHYSLKAHEQVLIGFWTRRETLTFVQIFRDLARCTGLFFLELFSHNTSLFNGHLLRIQAVSALAKMIEAHSYDKTHPTCGSSG